MKHIEKNFKDEIKNGVTIVDFWAEWCGPCKMFGPVFEKVEKELENIKFCKFNVDLDEDGICKELGIMSIPTIILFKDGEIVKKNIGFINEDGLKEFIGD